MSRLSGLRTKEDRFEDEHDNVETETTPSVVIINNTMESEPAPKNKNLVHYDFLGRYHFWIYLSIALVFGIIVFMMYQHNASALTGVANKYQTYFNPSVITILSLIALVAISYSTYQADMYCQHSWQAMTSNTFFMIFLFLFLAWGYLLFMTSQLTYAFWAAIVLLILVIIWFFWLWRIDRLSAYFMIYVGLLLVYLAYFTNQLHKMKM